MSTIQQVYAQLPHPLLPSLIEAGMICAAIVGTLETWKARKQRGK